MKVTSITQQTRNPSRVNISIDGVYRLSLDISQVVELGVKVGREYEGEELATLESESQFGKLYARALEYCLMRPHSAREVREYLYRKTKATRYKQKITGEIKERVGVSQAIADRVYQRLVDKGYIDDEKFARYWVEHRNQTRGVSQRKLQAELFAKGVASSVVTDALAVTERHDEDELVKVIAKKRAKYSDNQKFMHYLARQGFSYDDIKTALEKNED